jgi:hypothetical protein
MPAPGKKRQPRGKPAQATAAPRERLAAARLVGGPSGNDCAAKVMACIREQTGGKVVSSDATLESLGVDSELLAGCLEKKFHRGYTAADFPSTMTVQDVIDKVCGT